MNKRLNVRWAIGLIVAVVVTGIGLRFLRAYQQERHAGFFLEKARAATDEVKQRAKELDDSKNRLNRKDFEQAREVLGEAFDTARGFYVRYLALEPEDTDGLAEFGLFLADHDPHAAYETLEKVLRRDSSRTDVRRRVAEVAVAIRRYRDAREHLERHLLQAAPNDAELLVLLATCQIAAGEYQAAAETLKQAIAQDPQRLDLYSNRAAILRSELKEPEAADECMRQLIAANPDSAPAQVLYGQYLRSLLQFKEADAAAATALKSEPENVDALILAMQCAASQEDTETSEKHAQRVLQLAPHRSEPYETLAELQVRARKLDDAIAWLRKGVQARPGSFRLLFRLCDLLIAEGKLDEAAGPLQILEAEGAPQGLCKYLEGRIAFSRDQWRAARDAFELARPDLPPGYPISEAKVDFWLSRCYRQLGDSENERAASQRAVSADPDWLPTRITRAENLIAAGDLGGALEEYRAITQLKDAPARAWLGLARLMIVHVARSNPADRDWQAVDEVLNHVATTWPGEVGVVVLRAQKLVAQDKPAEAVQLVEDAARTYPDSLSLQLALAKLLENQEQWDQAEAVYDRTGQHAGDSVPLRIARAQHEVKRHGSEAGAVLRAFAEGTAGFSESDRVALWRGLADEADRIGDQDFVKQLWARIAAQMPDDLESRVALLDLAFQTKALTGVDQLLAEIRGIEGEGCYWHYGQACRLVFGEREPTDEELVRAQQHVSEARAKRPGWPSAARLAARIAQMRGDQPAAIEQLNSAIELGDRDPEAIRTLAEMLYLEGRYEEADQTLQRLGNRMALAGDLGRLATELSIRTDNVDRALRLARDTAAASNDVDDQIWLASVLAVAAERSEQQQATEEAQSMRKEAEGALRRAVELDGSSPVAWLQLIRFLVADQQKEAAAALIDTIRTSQAVEKDPTLVAICCELVGRDEEARSLFETAASAAGDDRGVARQAALYHLRHGRLAEAEAQLKRFLNGDLKAEMAEQMWARRTLAALRGQQDRLKAEASRDALALIGENLAIDPASVPDLRAKAYLLASSTVPAERREAIQLLTALVEADGRGNSDDRYQLAQIHARQGETRLALEQTRALVAGKGDGATYLPFHVSLLLDNGELSEAETWLKQLEKSAPDNSGTAMLRAELLLARGQFTESRNLLVAEAAKVDVQTTTGCELIRIIARQLEEFAGRRTDSGPNPESAAFVDEAEKLYRRYYAQQPEDRILLARFLGRWQRHAEAIQVVEESWEASPPDAVAAACDPLTTDRRVPESELKRIEVVLSKCLQKHPDHYVLLLVSANLLIASSKYDEAEAVYEGMLQRNDRDMAAMNNLALLRALRGHRLEQSMAMIGKAIEIYGANPSLLDTRATVHLARGQAREALADLNTAMTQRPSISHCFHLAQAYLKLGDDNSARQAFAEATRMGLGSEDLHELHQLERVVYEDLRRRLN